MERVRSVHAEWVTAAGLNPEEAADRLLRDLRSGRRGLTSREAERRLLQYGQNVLRRRGGRQRRPWPAS